MNTKIYFAKVRPEATIPSKRNEDAGYDIYACFDEDYMVIAPHETKLIPTGIASVCDKEYCFILKERGSTGTKGLAQRCGVIDSGYRNEWFVPITNENPYPVVIHKSDCNPYDIPEVEELVSNTPVYLLRPLNDIIKTYPYEKAIAQAMVVPVPQTEVVEITLDELNEFESERGEGALGSSGK